MAKRIKKSGPRINAIKDRKMAPTLQKTDVLELDRSFGDVVSSVVEQFSAQNRLQCNVRYHDQSLWLVWEKVNEEFFRQVQIAAFSGDSENELFFIPQAYGFDGEEVLATDESTTGRLTKTYSLRKLLSLKSQDAASEIKSLLQNAWTSAKQFTESQLTKVECG